MDANDFSSRSIISFSVCTRRPTSSLYFGAGSRSRRLCDEMRRAAAVAWSIGRNPRFAIVYPINSVESNASGLAMENVSRNAPSDDSMPPTGIATVR